MKKQTTNNKILKRLDKIIELLQLSCSPIKAEENPIPEFAEQGLIKLEMKDHKMI